LQRLTEAHINKGMASFRSFFQAISLLTVLVSSFAADPNPLLDPNDLPPYPTPGSLTVPTHSQQIRSRGKNPIAVPADAEEQALAKEVEDLQSQLDAAEAKAYRDDPALLLSDTYQEKAHEWVMSRHRDEFNASLNFAKLPRDQQALSRRSEVVQLIDTILFIELANNPKFLPLFASVYDATDSMLKTNKPVSNHLYNFDRHDKLIGYATDSATPASSSLNEYLGELNKRYPLCLSKLDDLKTQLAIPADAFAGLKFGELYRLLDGMAQFAVELRTPEEVKDLRKKLRSKGIQLGNLRAERKEQPIKP
jgi:hypothetical protein